MIFLEWRGENAPCGATTGHNMSLQYIYQCFSGVTDDEYILQQIENIMRISTMHYMKYAGTSCPFLKCNQDNISAVLWILLLVIYYCSSKYVIICIVIGWEIDWRC